MEESSSDECGNRTNDFFSRKFLQKKCLFVQVKILLPGENWRRQKEASNNKLKSEVQKQLTILLNLAQ